MESSAEDYNIEGHILEAEFYAEGQKDHACMETKADHIDPNSQEEDEAEFSEKLNLYSDDEDDEEVPTELTLWKKVTSWVLRHSKNGASINEILVIFREQGHIDFPKDARTLLGTPRKA